jgi:hypothetical protein
MIRPEDAATEIGRLVNRILALVRRLRRRVERDDGRYCGACYRANERDALRDSRLMPDNARGEA